MKRSVAWSSYRTKIWWNIFSLSAGTETAISQTRTKLQTAATVGSVRSNVCRTLLCPRTSLTNPKRFSTYCCCPPHGAASTKFGRLGLIVGAWWDVHLRGRWGSWLMSTTLHNLSGWFSVVESCRIAPFRHVFYHILQKETSGPK